MFLAKYSSWVGFGQISGQNICARKCPPDHWNQWPDARWLLAASDVSRVSPYEVLNGDAILLFAVTDLKRKLRYKGPRYITRLSFCIVIKNTWTLCCLCAWLSARALCIRSLALVLWRRKKLPNSRTPSNPKRKPLKGTSENVFCQCQWKYAQLTVGLFLKCSRTYFLCVFIEERHFLTQRKWR